MTGHASRISSAVFFPAVKFGFGIKLTVAILIRRQAGTVGLRINECILVFESVKGMYFVMNGLTLVVYSHD